MQIGSRPFALLGLFQILFQISFTFFEGFRSAGLTSNHFDIVMSHN